MEAEGHGAGCGGGHFCRRAVSALAYDAAAGCLVSECGFNGFSGIVLCHVDLPVDSILRYGVCGAAWFVAVSELV